MECNSGRTFESLLYVVLFCDIRVFNVLNFAPVCFSFSHVVVQHTNM